MQLLFSFAISAILLRQVVKKRIVWMILVALMMMIVLMVALLKPAVSPAAIGSIELSNYTSHDCSKQR